MNTLYVVIFQHYHIKHLISIFKLMYLSILTVVKAIDTQ